MTRKLFCIVVIACLAGCAAPRNFWLADAPPSPATSEPSTSNVPTPTDGASKAKNGALLPGDEKQLSLELNEIVKADQADRVGVIDWKVVSPRDLIRIKRVAEIFAEGGLRSSQDYAAAALVFQHGTVPDHYYQAYLWSKRAFELGDVAMKPSQKSMMVNAIDRYLINLGYKQLFGAQTFRGQGPGACHCLAPVENGLSEHERINYCGKSLQDRVDLLHENNKSLPNCEKALFCVKDLKTPPKGMFPGVW